MTRRSHFGSIRKRANGRFQALYFDVSGRRHSAGIFDTRGEASAALDAARTDINRGIWIDPGPGKELFGKYAKRWLEQRHDLAPRTRDQYRSLQNRHLLPAFGTTPIARIEKSQVRSWHAALAKQSPSVAVSAYRHLKAILNTAVEDEILARNPCSIKGAGSDRSAERVPPTTEQVRSLMEAMPAHLQAAVVIACALPIRRNEVLGLQRRDINIAERTLRVERQLDECPGELWSDVGPYRPTKTGESNTVQISPEVMDVLSAHLDKYVDADPLSPLFPAANGQPLRPGSFYNQWTSARKRVGLTTVRFHDLRHYAATILASNGASVAELKHRGRWKSNTMPLRYQHASKDRDVYLAKITAQFVPLPIVVADPLAPSARPSTIVTGIFRPNMLPTWENDPASSGGETRTLNLAVNSRLLCH